MGELTIAAAIVNWNSGRALRACIESLIVPSTAAEIAEIIVIDNASEDDSLKSILEFSDRVTVVRNRTNRGLASAMNQAFAATTSASVLMLNPDVRATPGAVSVLAGAMKSAPRTGAVGGYVNDKYLPRPLPTSTMLLRQNLGLARGGRAPERNGEPRAVDQPAAAALLIRREAFAEVGGFDELFYPAWYEDVDFCCRLKAAGWAIYFAPQAEFLHEGGYSAKALGPSRFAEIYYRNQVRYAKKHFGLGASIAVRASIVIGMLGRMVLRPAQLHSHWKALVGACGRW